MFSPVAGLSRRTRPVSFSRSIERWSARTNTFGWYCKDRRIVSVVCTGIAVASVILPTQGGLAWQPTARPTLVWVGETRRGFPAERIGRVVWPLPATLRAATAADPEQMRVGRRLSRTHQPLTDEEIEILARYLASLPPGAQP